MLTGISIALTQPRGGPAAYTFTNSEASDLVARMSSTPDNTRKALIDNLVGALKTASVWDKLDFLDVLAAADSQAALLNWKGATFDPAAVTSPSFVADRGYQKGASTGYLTTGGYVLGTSGTSTQNSSHLGIWSLTDDNTGSKDIGGLNDHIESRSAGSFLARLHNGASSTIAVADSLGHFVISRGAAAGYEKYKAGASVESVTATSGAPANSPVLILCRNSDVAGGAAYSQGSIRRIAIAHGGAALTAQNVADMNTAFSAYLTGVGAI